MSISLVAVDMDGTFLRPDMTYDRERFLRIRERMRQSGIPFVVASGNQYWQLTSFFQLRDDIAYVAENGHFVYQSGASAPLDKAAPRPGTGRKLIAALEEQRVPYLLSTGDGALVPAWEGEDDREWWPLYYPRMRIVEDPYDSADQVIKATARTPDPHGFVARTRERLGDDFVPVVSGPQDADVNAPGRNKARGLQILASALGIDLSHAIAFGDSHNDLEMLQAVGTPVAMQGAAADVKDSAIRIAPPNSQDGVLQVLDEVL